MKFAVATILAAASSIALAMPILLATPSARAATVQIDALSDNSHEYSAPTGTTAHLGGVLSSDINSYFTTPERPSTVTVTPLVSVVGLGSTGSPHSDVFALAPITVPISYSGSSGSFSGHFDALVDLSFAWGDYEVFRVDPGFTGNFESYNIAHFTGALTVTDAAAHVPEPASLALLGLGLAGLAAVRRRVA